MQNQLTVIEQKLNSPDVTNRLIVTLGLDPADERSQSEAFKYASSVLAEIQKTAGDPKKDLTVCSPDSIIQSMIDAAQFKLAIDGRQHAHLIKYGNKATFQIGYRAYLAKFKEHYPDADFIVEPIYKGDELKIWHDNDTAHYSLAKRSPFGGEPKDLEGVLVGVTYTDNGRLITKLMPVPKSRIDRAQRSAKQQFIWESDYIEKAKAAAIKNAFKVQFAAMTGLQDMVKYDNEANHSLAQPASPVRSSIVDNINKSIAPSEPETIQEAEVVEPSLADDLIKEGDIASSEGVENYKAWIATLSEEEKTLVKHKHKDWSIAAKTVDSNKGLEPSL